MRRHRYLSTRVALVGVAGCCLLAAALATSSAEAAPSRRPAPAKSSTASSPASPAAAASLRLAVISYWDPADYAKLPAGSLAVVNPADGIVGADAATVTQLRQAVGTARARGVHFLGYVPTGYGVRTSGAPNDGGTVGQSLSDVRRQIELYASTFGSGTLDGIFFDEASQPCGTAARDYATFSAQVRAAGFRQSAFNPGWVGDGYCFVDATPRGDVVVTFESDLTSYLTDPDVESDLGVSTARAHARGALTWHLVHSATGTQGLRQALAALRRRAPDLGYVTDIGGDWQAGENTWGSPPSYWTTEVRCLGSTTTCPGL